MTPVDVVSSFERHIQVEVHIGLSTMVAARQKAMQPMLTRLRSLKPSMEEVTEVLAYLGEDTCIFSAEERQSIGTVAQATMVDPVMASTRATVKTQQHLFLHRYLPLRMWAFLESDHTIENKFRQLSQFMCQCLGLRNPDAKTKRLAVVLVHLASKTSPTPKDAYKSIQTFSNIMEQKRSSVCTSQTMSTFPEDPGVSMDAHPTAYAAEDPPIACRLSEVSIVERCRKGITPCRCTNQQVREPTMKPSQTSSPSHTGDSVKGALLALLENFMTQKGNHNLREALVSHEESSVTSSPTTVGTSSTPVGVDSPSGPSSPAQQQLFSAGIEPRCLDPCHNKLAQLKTRLGCADPVPLEDEIPRLSTKRPREPDEEDEPEAPVHQCRQVMRKPAAASQPSRMSTASNTASQHEASLNRPPPSQGPTRHAGGKIYWSSQKSAYRVYLRVGDRIEKQVPANSSSKHDMRQKFFVCCALIVNDTRPILTWRKTPHVYGRGNRSSCKS